MMNEMKHEIHEYDTVKLRREVDGVPAGALGLVASEYPDSALVELADPTGERDLFDDLIRVAYEDLLLVESASAVAR